MRKYFRGRSYVFLIVFICFSFYGGQSSANEEEKQKNKLIPQNPWYELKLNFNEFSILNSSIMGGLKKYGGGAEFNIRMAKEGDEMVWTIRITNQKLIEVLGYWTAEKSAQLINSLDTNNLDAAAKLTLGSMKSVNQKVAHAQTSPKWDPVTLSGLVVEEDGVLYIEGQEGKYQATGDYLKELGQRKGKRVIAKGFVKVEDHIEVRAFLERKENTLELFVMSMCPFAKIAECSILEFLETYSEHPKPSLEIRYIFYEKDEGAKQVFTSMHGEPEVEENLVQMVIRDGYPEFYHNYLLKRVDDKDTPWDKLAKETGLKDEEVKSIERTIEKERETLIQQEYDYVTGTYQIYDGSPSYVWECERVANIRQLEVFRGLKFSSDRCSDGGK